ncbi:MAG: hypothetical protein AAGD01_15165 [Acidobacteriota bacterium]
MPFHIPASLTAPFETALSSSNGSSAMASVLGLALSWGLMMLAAAVLVAPPVLADVDRADAESDVASDRAAFEAAAELARETLRATHGESEAERIDQGVAQVLARWVEADGTPEELQAFLEAEFLPRGEVLDQTFQRLEFGLERAGGYFTSMGRDLSRGSDLEIGPMLPIDSRMAAWNPGAHLLDDLFKTKIAFVALLNFPLTTLGERLQDGPEWTRRQWAEARLTETFASRVPAAVSQATSAASSAADNYINGYNFHLHHLLTAEGERLFPKGLRLISHWGLRDELKARYADPQGVEKQRLIATLFDHIVQQQVPAVVIDNPEVDWTPATGALAWAPGVEGKEDAPDATREADERYRQWMGIFRAQQMLDEHRPDQPSLIARRFNENREIPADEVESLLISLLESPLAKPVAELVSQRLGRPLEPFDIWYNGFRAGGSQDEDALSAITRERYPTADAFAADIPRLLRDLGFSDERAAMMQDYIVVEPSRGAGHAYGGSRRDDKAHLRTRVGEQGMDYKGYNIAVHELGHNVEQVFSVTLIDHTLLQGVPNTAFTEALAFVFQDRDLNLLGQAEASDQAAALAALDTFWGTREIGAVGLVDLYAWRWLYEHPEGTPEEFRAAVVKIAQHVWNRYFAEVFGHRDSTLLAVYSHMVDGTLYTPDYSLGLLIAFQIEEHFRGRDDLGAEFERMTLQGRLTPNQWMRGAVGAPLTAEPLLQAVGGALETLGGDAEAAR